MGKTEHLNACSVPNPFYHPLALATDDAPERNSPLISQPLIELCLSIPIYLLALRGQNRFIAREAFRGLVPDEIVERRAKGSADSFTQRLFARNLPFAREMLLDGLLVSHGYLDRKKLQAVLLQPDGVLMPEAAEVVLFHLNTECWLRGVSAKWPRLTTNTSN